MSEYNYTNLTPFKWFILENFPFIEESLDAITNYQIYCKLGEEINKIINKVNESGEEIETLTNSFIALQNYVNNYFSNLDVQDEIDNKLDEMAQNGTLAEILRNTKFVASNLNFRNVLIKYVNDTDIYNGLSHNQPQGFCMINSEICCIAFINSSYNDDYTRLLVFNINTGEIIKDSYVEGYHANSLSFNSLDNKIYIANCNTRGNTPNNNISVIDYVSMTKESEITISNLPSGQRIRSFSYDRVNDKYYAGNINTVYEIDIDTLTIVNTIELSNVENVGTNQTIKVFDNKIISFNTLAILFYDLQGNLLQIQNIEHSYNNLNTGEPEDFDLTENQDLIFTSSSKQSPRDNIINLQIYKANIYKNSCNILPYNLISSSATTSFTIYVNCQGTNIYEDGTQTYPYKSLQTAITIAKQYKQSTIIRISGTEVDDYVYINGIPNISFAIDNDITFGTIEVNSSTNLLIWSQNSKSITSMKKLIITGFSKVTANNIQSIINDESNCIDISLSSYLYLTGTTLNSGNNNDIIKINGNSKIYLKSCIFNNYSGHYALNIQDGSEAQIFSNTFNIASSSSQHDFYLNNGRLISDFKIIDYNRVVLSNNSFVSALIRALSGDTYFGDLCNVPNGAKSMLIRSKIPSVGTMTICNMYDLNSNQVIQGSICRDSGITLSYIELTIASNILKISGNRVCSVNASNYTYSTINDNSQGSSSYGSVRTVYFVT